jgi:hypothetical protein
MAERVWALSGAPFFRARQSGSHNPGSRVTWSPPARRCLRLCRALQNGSSIVPSEIATENGLGSAGIASQPLPSKLALAAVDYLLRR